MSLCLVFLSCLILLCIIVPYVASRLFLSCFVLFRIKKREQIRQETRGKDKSKTRGKGLFTYPLQPFVSFMVTCRWPRNLRKCPAMNGIGWTFAVSLGVFLSCLVFCCRDALFSKCLYASCPPFFPGQASSPRRVAASKIFLVCLSSLVIFAAPDRHVLEQFIHSRSLSYPKAGEVFLSSNKYIHKDTLKGIWTKSLLLEVALSLISPPPPPGFLLFDICR